RMAFLAANPTSTTRPICVKMLLSIPFSQMPIMADSTHMGTMRMMANGIDQLSYWADSTRKTNSTDSGKMNGLSGSLAASISWKLSSVHSKPMDDGNSRLARVFMMLMASPELVPGRVAPVISADGYML